jgi:hypothetical protein
MYILRLRAFGIKAWKFGCARNPHYRSVQHISQLINGAKSRNEATGEKTLHEKGKERERK